MAGSEHFSSQQIQPFADWPAELDDDSVEQDHKTVILSAAADTVLLAKAAADLDDRS